MSDSPDPQRLEQLDESITKLEGELHDLDPATDEDQKFIDDGATPDSEVDNTIVPPG